MVLKQVLKTIEIGNCVKEKNFPVDFKALDALGQSPLFAAIRGGNIEILRIMLDYYKAKQLNINSTDDYGWTALVSIFSKLIIVSPRVGVKKVPGLSCGLGKPILTP